MPRKGLTIPEALKVFHNLSSDIESDESSLSETEDVMTAKTDLEILATFQPNVNPEDVLIAVSERNLTERDGCALTVMTDYV
ncbi:hypothetical protein TNCV_1629481 [Trichonephila clavipes]|uniref:Uncharacterized protein n=1 Tax=Trichonephila clavipes TaxID=2585209 RepID=A0A8X7BH03_TRICX|nr:hypothetical protein TNCV_1629481 [Trichonephila clavipes]